ncbi:MAG: methyltransferase domain-containing protein [Armatimonadetes bacterium]|nr:methyltransferase domain-containing protein [Akkermansiaceae bacterium]
MSAVYESPTILAEYLLFHYGSADEVLPPHESWPIGMGDALDFAVRTPSYFSNPQTNRGLDLGCAVGRSTYEMSRTCGHVIGMDYSHAFINAAQLLRSGKSIPYPRHDEGHLETLLEATLPEDVYPHKTGFFQGDAMRLPNDIGSFDRVHAANLLCRLTDPELLLKRLPDLVGTGGQLVIATPCTWLAAFTPPDHWPPGDTLSWLKNHLCDHFELITEANEPFLIRETARKFQWTRSLVTVWQK